jgi:hypothetical protein
MISKRTTLILGAGASVPYEFPTGAGLTDRVINALAGPGTNESKMLQELGHSPEDIAHFRNSLRYSGKASVDAFLEHRESFMEIGKAAIACSLIPYEKPDRLFKQKDNWYQHLYNALNAGPDDFGNNNLNVISFNYDRSLENYLHTCLLHSYGLTEAESARLVQTVPIVHIHGQLGKLPWQDGSLPEKPYDPALNAAAIAAARDSIRIIHENRYDDPIVQRAQEIANQAEVLVFIGFGYHDPNLDRINLALDQEREFVGGSCKGFTEMEKTMVARRLPNAFTWGYNSWGALEFLRERVSLL